MTTEWRELKTLQEVAAAQAAGEEIEVHRGGGVSWTTWNVEKHAWYIEYQFRSRPKKRTKTIVLREALIDNSFRVVGTEEWIKESYRRYIINLLDTPAREIEVEE